MSVAHATALLPAGARIVVRDHAPVEDASALLALARWAMRFSPAVAPDYPDGLMLNVTGCQRLYGGDERLAALVMQSIRALGLDARVAIAPTIGAAWAVARFATDQRRINAKAQRAQRENKEEKREEGGVVARQRGAAARMRPVARNFAAVSMPDDRRDLNSSAFAPSLRLCVVPGWRVVSEHEWPALFQRLPIAALRVERKVVDELAEVGIDHVRQLLAIPRDEIASRFDADVLLRIDQATGEAMEMLRPLRHEEPPAVAIRFAGPTTQFEAVEQASRKLVEMLCNRLLKREAGARRIVLEVERMNQDLHPEFAQEVLTLSRPSRSAKHLWNLLRPRVERLHLGEGVEQLSLTARRCAPLPHEQEQLDGSSGESEAATTARLQEAAGQLIDLLESRLGPPAVLAGEIVQTHIPEASFRFRPASEGGLKMTPAPRADSRVISPDPAAADAVEATSTFIPLPGDRPTVLFDEPEAVAVTLLQPEGPVIGLQWRRLHRITTAIGPERIGRRWWHFRLTRRQPARDYYRLQDEEGLWLWVYRSRFSRKWFVHGVWS
jgi:protein ImuB